MSRLLPLAALFLAWLAPLPVAAQSFTRRDVPRGQVSGLEMGIEGNLVVAPGGRVRWFVTIYEITGGRQLRPSPKTALRALASFHRSEPVAEVVTDSEGRARLDFTVPDDLEQPFHLVVEARSPRGVMRKFDVSVAHTVRYQTELFVDRPKVSPGDSVQVWGRVLDSVANRPVANHRVRVTAKSDHYLIGREQELRTDTRGFFRATVKAPDRPASITIEVDAEKSTRRQEHVAVEVADLPALIIYARPEKSVVSPGTTVQVDVVVRTPDGQPVANARLTGLSIPPEIGDDGKKNPPTLTDARGRARVGWEVKSSAQVEDVSGQIAAVRTGIGTGGATVTVRAARVTSVVTWAVDGGALIPGLPARIFVKAYHPDGRPQPGLAVRLEGGRIEAAPATTDPDGVAVFDATIAEVDPDPPSSCHGPTVAAATLGVGAETRELCLPVDPDATVRVRTEPTVAAGGELVVRWFARPSVAASPISVTLLGRVHGASFAPVAQAVVAARSDRVTFTVPPELVGPIWVRARPLLGPERQEVRGGSTLAWSAPRHDFGVTLTPSANGSMQLVLGGAGNQESIGFAFALSVRQGRQLIETLRRAQGDWPGTGVGAASWMGFLAARTPADNAVSAVLRDGARVILAMPEDSVAVGLLRDPWRTRARFVRGRLGRLLFAIETLVAQNLPDNLQDVAVEERGRYRFNSEILTLIAAELGAEAIAGLDGSPLTIEALQALDPNITFDNVARRLTRERLLTLLVALRHFVKESQLDFEWARRGDPGSWLTGLVGWSSDDGEITIEREDLFDGWGRPFKIQPARGARARFRFLEPIVGYELISAGPDRRYGNGDDLFDPFARILPQQSIYGEAVGEEPLLARLRGVELGRATIAVLMEPFEIGEADWAMSESTAPTQSWESPSRVADSTHALAAEPVGAGFPAAASVRALAPGRGDIDLRLSPDPHNYLVVAGAYAPDGTFAFDAKPLRAGVPLLVDARMPTRLRPHEPLRVPVHIVGLDGKQEIQITVEADGVLEVAARGDTRLTLDAGETRTVELEIGAGRVGSGRIYLRILGPDGKVLRQATHHLRVMWDGSLRAQHGGALVAKRTRLELRPPEDARPVRSQLVVSAPRDLLRDPGFRELRRQHPELLGWAHAMRGEPLPKSLAAELAGRRDRIGPMPFLEGACAAVAWSSMADPEEDEDEPNPEIGRAIARVGVAGGPDSMRERSALLVALSASASLATGGPSGDPISALVSRIREDGWHAPMTEQSRPSVMARMAAGLLLADRRDIPGRELFNRGRAALVKGSHGGKVLPGEDGRAVDGWIGTVALAIAARQLGEDLLAEELIRGIAPRLYLGMEGGFEPGFWLLAASVYGVFGIDGPATVTVKVDGKTHRLALDRGVATLPLPNRKVSVELDSPQPVLARVEARYVRPVTNSSHAALVASLEGHAGYLGDTAALEVVVRNTSGKVVASPVLEVMLPSAGVLSESALRTIAAAPAVAQVDPPDSQGLLRIYLAPIAELQDQRLPLPIQWIGGGKVKGLSVIVFDADQPWLISSSASRIEELTMRPKETWR